MSKIEDELELAKEVFLTGVDEEDLQQNKDQIDEWHRSLIENKAYLKWQNSDITRMISKQARDSYQDASLSLARRRDLTEQDRIKLYATQDACAFILSLTEKDAKGSLEQLGEQIRHALRAVS
jgi:hypothetical protein